MLPIHDLIFQFQHQVNHLRKFREVHPAYQKQGKVQSKGAVKKRLEVKFKGWSVYQKASGSDRMEDEAGNTIAEMTDLKYNSGTFIEYDPSIDDRLMMTLSLVIRAYNKSVERRAHANNSSKK